MGEREGQGGDEGMTVVYAISWSSRGPSKVGIADNPIGRLADLQVSHPFRLRIFFAAIVADRKAAFTVEQATLRHLNQHRLLGEWVKVSPARLAEAVCAVAKRHRIAFEKWRPTIEERLARDAQIAAIQKPTERAALAYDEARRLRAEIGGF
jgi:Meiotically up-regulated gene 113